MRKLNLPPIFTTSFPNICLNIILHSPLYVKMTDGSNTMSNILTAVSVKLKVSWDVMPCNLVTSTRTLGTTAHNTVQHTYNLQVDLKM
jgi:hypothetical protein